MQKKKPKFYLLIYALFIVGFIYFYYSDYHDHNILSPVIILLCLFPLVIRCIYWQVRPIKPSIRLTIIIVSYLGSLLFFFTNTGNIKSVFFVTLVYLVIPLLIGIIMFFITKKKEDILLILMSFIILLIIPVIYFSVENAIETIKYSGLSRTERIHHLLDQKEMTGDINTEVKNYILSTQHLQPEMYIPVTTIYTGGNFENHSFKGKTVIHWYYIKKRNVKKLYYMKFRIDSNYRATDVTITSYDSSLFDHSANIDTTAINAAVKLDAAAVK